jgi:predicted protein tyrosine phosphatase
MSTKSHPPDLPYSLSVCGKSEIDGFAHRAITHLLSIEDPDTPKDTPAWFKGVHWQIQFHDVESLAEAHTMNAVAATREQVAEILQFGEECLRASRRTPVHLLVHCYAGASRSPAACYALAAQALGPGRAADALEYVIRIREEAVPNLLVVQLADDLLQRNGEMIRALAPMRHALDCAVEEWLVEMERAKHAKRTL